MIYSPIQGLPCQVRCPRLDVFLVARVGGVKSVTVYLVCGGLQICGSTVYPVCDGLQIRGSTVSDCKSATTDVGLQIRHNRKNRHNRNPPQQTFRPPCPARVGVLVIHLWVGRALKGHCCAATISRIQKKVVSLQRIIVS